MAEVQDNDNDQSRRQLCEQLYSELHRELWAIFYSHCSDPERAYDAVQESFLRFYDYDGEPIRDPRAWLLRVGQNWLRDVARKKYSECRLMPAMDDFFGADFAVGASVEAQERQGRIRQALRELNEDDRKVLVMKYALDWSAAQIATAMDSSTAAIDMRLSRARRRLAEVLSEQGFEYEHDS
ncbi:MAG: sigma-70 family RNA polymerase sigma factor [Planctomycetaceae bacterium]|nr:sigma-70 family RNA polymerase sigma factor [Planctomycetaceae bacterium]